MPSLIRTAVLLIAAVLAVAPQAQADVRTQTRAQAAPKVPSAVQVIVDYQRVGHDLLELQEQRGKFDCGDLMPRFRAIKLDADLATPAGRIATAATLADISSKIERLRGVKVHAECLDNPLAAGCS